MPSSYTTSLRLTLPATGELGGQWGNTVNTGITELLDASVAGTTTISTWGGAGVAYTLSNNSGLSDEARRMFIVATGTPGEAKNVICPAVSKFYVFRNDTTGGFALTLKTSGGTGIAVPAGQYKFLYCNGTDVLEMFNSAGALTLSGALSVGGTTTLASNPTLSAGTANQVQYLNASKVLVGSANLTFDGTSLTLGGNPTVSSGTANGVTYLNGSKVLTTGSALTFDGTNFAVNTGSVTSGNSTFAGSLIAIGGGSGATVAITPNTVSGANGVVYNTSFVSGGAGPHVFQIGGSEQMRLTSTGLGIGTSSPGAKVDAAGNIRVSYSASGGNASLLANNTSSTATSTSQIIAINDASRALRIQYSSSGGIGGAALSGGFTGEMGQIFTDGNYPLTIGVNSVAALNISTSGNLGLGVTPSAWNTDYRALQIKGGITLSNDGSNTDLRLGQNVFVNSSAQNIYIATAAATRYRQSSGSHIWDTAPSGTAGNAITFTQAMTLDASGNLAVGTTTADVFGRGYGGRILAVSGSSQNAIVVNSATGSAFIETGVGGTRYCYLNTASTDVTLGTAASIPLIFTTNNTERARITSGGDLLVGTTNSSLTTDAGVKITPSATAPQIGIVGSDSANTSVTYRLYSTGAADYRFYVGYGGTVYATNTTISAISDQRYKENIQDLDVGLDKIMALKPRKFDWKAGKGKDIKGDRGFIAQEFEQVFPDLIDEWAGPAPEGEEPYKSVRQDLIPVLVKAIQELKAELDSVKAELATLKGQP